jgi:hypothetical protein
MMYKYPFLDFGQLNDLMNSLEIKASDKLRFIYESMYGVFHDQEKELMAGSVVGLVAIGGIPITIKDGKTWLHGQEITPDQIKHQLMQTVGMSSFMSYLNPKNKTLEEMAQTTIDINHLSVLHTISFSILMAGISSGVEHELSSQRDIVHLSRLTVAKTKAQDSPCLVLRDRRHVDAYKKVLAFTKTMTSDIEDSETRNLLFPSAKASAVIITGTLKNLLKLVALKDAGGKEAELVELLVNLERILPSFQKLNI